MDRLAFNAAAAINEMRTSRQMTTNELANVATPGFKRSFESAMMTLKVQGAGFESRLQPQAYSSDNINMKPGTVLKTGRDLDVAMDEQAVMGVSAPNGELAFTRRGDLRLNGNGVLETGVGAMVRGQNGGPITIPPGFLININKDGAVFATNPGQPGVAAPVLIDRILLRDASQTALERREDGLYRVVGKPNEDIPITGKLTTLSPETLEGSNVNAMEVMVKLMDQSRSFEMQVNVIKQSKDVDESGGSMMRASS
ncbi:MAG: Flagellar basal-body rod protein FlgF [Pseudomonadota bacterium]|jgi:flagellar basal-body rod protein FlgF